MLRKNNAPREAKGSIAACHGKDVHIHATKGEWYTSCSYELHIRLFFFFSSSARHLVHVVSCSRYHERLHADERNWQCIIEEPSNSKNQKLGEIPSFPSPGWLIG